jgi:hypothetical protein
MSEDVFWNLDYSSLVSILDNKLAYDGYIDYVKQKEMDRASRRR